MRGNIYYAKKLGIYIFKCFNCGDKAVSLLSYIQEHFPDIYSTHIYNRYLQSPDESNSQYKNYNLQKSSEPEYLSSIWLKLLTHWTHSDIAKKYLDYRMIPINKRSDIYFIDDINTLLEEANKSARQDYKLLNYKSPRIVFPVFTRERNIIIGFVCRSILTGDFIRYYNIKLSEDKPLVLGLDRINTTQPIYITEGYFDSLFLKNAIAANTASGYKNCVDFCHSVNQKPILIFDNEPNNQDIVNIMERWINKNESVVIYTSFPYQGKDINAMVMNNPSINIEEEIKQKVYSGLIAKLNLTVWKKEGLRW